MGERLRKMWDNYYGWHLLTFVGMAVVAGVVGFIAWIGTQLCN